MVNIALLANILKNYLPLVRHVWNQISICYPIEVIVSAIDHLFYHSVKFICVTKLHHRNNMLCPDISNTVLSLQCFSKVIFHGS